jgi:cathepsin H
LQNKVKHLNDVVAPASWDWRDFGVVTPVKAQGHCGSCWTFSTVGCLESHYMLAYGQFRNLSEQQLVDCAGAFDNHGCNGGLPSHAFEYVKYAGGITGEQDYPYVANMSKGCDPNNINPWVGVEGGSVNITAGDEGELRDALFQKGPVSVCFQVVAGFRDYTTGVYNSTVCNKTADWVNHAVLAVGYGTDTATTLDYWIVKNSWGATWGDKGFFKIQRGTNTCGIATCNSYPQKVFDASINMNGRMSVREIAHQEYFTQ